MVMASSSGSISQDNDAEVFESTNACVDEFLDRFAEFDQYGNFLFRVGNH